ncbi:branched-chain amino acid ABC transporter ATP-binding protein/permease [Arthrobacter ginkgonis]|uniref:Branched-chain amino acid ABC transporter ATP-binding protein/permease n=1 Tax=Arthrobacter ginkgonis TaxID=1630594 RepID=A0ABP7DKK7_9MICC
MSRFAKTPSAETTGPAQRAADRARPRAHGLGWRHGAGALIWILAVIAAGLCLAPYWQGIGASVGLMALLALGMILVTGYAGQFSLAVGAFYGIGAYGSALLTMNFGWAGLLAIVASAAVAAVAAYLLGRPIFRLRGHFLAMATLALSEVFFLLVNNLEITGGSSGLPLSALNVFGVDLFDTGQHFILNWLIVGLVLWGCLRLAVGREGRALKAIRGHEAAAASAGIDIGSSKTRVFIASAVISSLAGSLYAHQVMYVNPPPFGVVTAIDVLVIAVLGGMRSPWGAIIGAVVLEFLHQGIEGVLTQLLGSAAVGAGQTLVLGFLLVVILILRPDGIVGVVEAAARRLRRNGRPTELGAPPEAEAEYVTMTQARARDDAERAEQGHEAGGVVLSARGLVKRFGGVTAVNDITLDIHAGEVLAVIGPNGAGKSTLVNLLSGNLLPTAGAVSIENEDFTGKPAHVVARHGLSRSFQTPCLFEGMDVLSTVKVGAHLRGRVGMLRSSVPTRGALREERELDRLAHAVLERLSLGHLAAEDAKNLSLGQQKKIEIARALVANPKVLLLDEPCAGLNKAEKKSLLVLLRQLGREGIAVLVIEHDMEFVMAAADRVHVVNFGATLKVGAPAEVQADQSVIDAYLGVPASETTQRAQAPTAVQALETEAVR